MAKWVAGAVLVLLAVPLLLVAAVLALANIGPGRALIEDQTAKLTGGAVRIEGLGGRFPDALTAGRIEVSDAKGPYVTVSGLRLEWSPLKLLEGTAQIERLDAERVDFPRLPESEGGGGGGSFELPVRVDLRHLHIDRGIVGVAVAGAGATLEVDGSADLTTLTEGTVRLDVQRLDSPGHYAVSGSVGRDAIRATLTAAEPAQGLISSIAGLPDLGAVSLQASVNGPRDGLGTQVGIDAGPLTASASGTVDLDHLAADLTVRGRAPAMAPGGGISWQSVAVDASVHGPFTRPDASGTLRIASLNAAGVRIGALDATVSGNSGRLAAHADVRDLHVPGPRPDIFAGSPVAVDASAQLDAPDRPVSFSLRHPLLAAQGTARTLGAQQVQAHLVLPDLAPLAAAGGVALSGSSELDVQAEMRDDTVTAAAKGRVGISGGMAPVPELIGNDGSLDVAVSVLGRDVTVSRLVVSGRALEVSARGGMTSGTIAADWTVGLADIGVLQPNLSGRADARGHAGGTLEDLAVQADIGADLAAKGYASGHLTARVDATGLPDAPHASVTATGTLLDAPLSLALTVGEADGAVTVDVGQASWKSLQAGGTARLTPPAVVPSGSLHVGFGRLADLEPLLGRPVAGSAKATLDADDKAARLSVTVLDAAVPGVGVIGKAVLNATVTDPAGRPLVDGTLAADGISAGGAKAVSVRIAAKGPLDALGVTVTADAPAVAGGAAKLTTAGTLNAGARSLALVRLEANWKQQALRLLAPAKFGFADGVAVDRLRLGFGQAELAVSGSAGDRLDLTATLRNLPADVGAMIDPSFAADGTIGAEAHLTGSVARPEGTAKVTASGLRQRSGPGQALPAANLVASAVLLGTSVRLDSRLAAGPSHVSVTGTAPLATAGPLDLVADGALDLAMLDPLLTAQGRRARGNVTLNATVTGTIAAPLVRGTAELRNGDVTDYTLGAHVTALTARIEGSGDSMRLAQFSGKAGPGTLGGSGTIGLNGAMPVDLHFTADNARPLSSDLMTALIDANLTVQGDVERDVTLGGTLHVRRADIRIPDKLPASVAVLPVRVAGAPVAAAPAAAPQSAIALNLTLEAPEQVFIRGRGVDAELGGTIRIHGTASNPQPDGGLQLRRGTVSVIGTTLNFSEGTIDFSGAGLTDPSIRFVATSSTSSLVATLTVGGDVRNPKITLSSVPDMPQDEILSQLLFNTSTSKLNPLQLAQIAAALASLSGATSGFDPLESLRGALGLDRLSVGSNGTGSPTLQAGRYLARGVYLGAQQSASGGTLATVQIDLAKGLKLETSAGSGASSATGSTSSADAASVGITYQFEY